MDLTSLEFWTLASTAVGLGVLHTFIGPDHYVPFVFLARARGWSLWKTGWITFLCGLGHVGGSVILGLIGIGLGLAIARVKGIEAVRGDIAAWLLISFGLVYGVWGLRRAWHGHSHSHGYSHGHSHSHEHSPEHSRADTHRHLDDPLASETSRDPSDRRAAITPWVLFIIFVFGPCEVLIPLVMYPAAQGSLWGVVLVAGFFGVATIGTMLAMVLALALGLSTVRLNWLERYNHGLAGIALAVCGGMILFAGF